MIFKVGNLSIISVSPFEKSQNLFNRHTVQDMLRLAPAAAGDTDPEAHQFQLPCNVGIRPDGKHDPLFPCTVDMNVLEIEAARHGIDLQDFFVFGRGIEDTSGK